MKYMVTLLCILCISTLINAKIHNTIDIYPMMDKQNGIDNISVKAVLTSAALNLMLHFPEKKLDPIIVLNHKSGPMTLYQRGENNEYIILVNIHGRYWDQLSYQFSHELCHVLSNYGNDNDKNQWLDESLCEAISLYTVEKMSIQWQEDPPYPHWKPYALSIKEYLNKMLHKKHRTEKPNLSQWFDLNKKSLRDNPYLRNKNEVIGTAIYRLIKLGTFKISTIQYLNLGASNKDKSIASKLKEWYQNSPTENKKSVLSIAELLGIKI